MVTCLGAKGREVDEMSMDDPNDEEVVTLVCVPREVFGWPGFKPAGPLNLRPVASLGVYPI